MYKAFYGLNDNPFSIAPNPHYLFLSDRHREALTHLTYGLGETGGFVLLTGEVGTGKTTVSRCLLNQLPENTDTAFILNPSLTELELLATLCDELSIRYQESPTLKQLTDLISQYLLENHKNGRNTVLIIDEAQHLRAEVLEQLRLLTNLETDTKKLLQVILIGQPELQQLLKRQELRQLAQRITARYHLLPLTMEEVGLYVLHRLQVAGRYEPLFNAGAIKALHKYSDGIPRLINLLCERSLMAGYAQSTLPIDKKMVSLAASEVFGYEPQKRSFLWPGLTAVALVGSFAAAFAVFTSMNSTKLNGGTPQSTAISNTAIVKPIAGGELQAPELSQNVQRSQTYNQDTTQLSSQVNLASSNPALVQQRINHSSATAQNENADRLVEFQPSNEQHPFSEVDSQQYVVNNALPLVAQSQGVLLSKMGEERATAPLQFSLGQVSSMPAESVASKIEAKEGLAPLSEQDVINQAIAHSQNIETAFAALFGVWGKAPIVGLTPCDTAEHYGLDCYQQQGNWLSITRLNYPAVVYLVNQNDQSFFGTVVSRDKEQLLLQLGEQQLWVTRDWFTRYFSGTFEILWQAPSGLPQEISRNSSSGQIQWLENSLAHVDNTVPRLVKGFDNALEQRLKIFQRRHGLKPDGIAGSQTLVKLNLFLSLEGPRLQQGDRF